MTGSLEFPYRHKAKVVFWLVTSFILMLVCIVGLVFIAFKDELSLRDFASLRGGKALVAIPFGALFVLLLPFYLIRAQRGVLRVTASDVATGSTTIPFREIRKLEIREVDKKRTLYVLTANAKLWLMICESRLPGAQAFDQIQQALLSSRTDWRNNGTVWSVK